MTSLRTKVLLRLQYSPGLCRLRASTVEMMRRGHLDADGFGAAALASFGTTRVWRERPMYQAPACSDAIFLHLRRCSSRPSRLTPSVPMEISDRCARFGISGVRTLDRGIG